MYSIKIEGDFSSAHNLRGYKGKCEELHGHNWKVAVEISAKKLDKAGLLIDFRIAKKHLNEILDNLDHKYLNKIAYFSAGGMNPTSENIARFIFDHLKKKIAGVNAVTVWESDKCSATYDEK